MELATFLLFCLVIALFVLRGKDRELVDDIARRVAQLEADRVRTPRPVDAEPAVEPAPPAPAPAPHPAPAPVPVGVVADPEEPRFEPAPTTPAAPRVPSIVERVVAEHALSIVGGLFVVVAAVLFVGFAIDQGWIGPWAKFALALALGAALVAAALLAARRVPAEERIGNAIGSLHGVLAGTGAAVAFIAIVAAVRVQELFAPGTGALAEVLVAVGAVQLARVWHSQDLAAFGMGVGLAAPMLVGAEPTTGTLVLLSVTLVASTVLAVLESWPRLLLGAALVTTPQLLSFAQGSSITSTIIASLAWWALLAAGCVVATLRGSAGSQRSIISTVFVVSIAAGGFVRQAHGAEQGSAWTQFLFALALLDVLVGLALLARDRGRSDLLATAFIAAGATLAATALADVGQEAGRVAGWAAEAVALTVLWWRVRGTLTAVFAGALAALATLYALVVVAPPTLLFERSEALATPLVALGSLVIAALALGVLQAPAGGVAAPAAQLVRRAIDGVAAAGTWYLCAIVLVQLASRMGDAASIASLVLGAWAAAGAVLAARQYGIDSRDEAGIAAAGATLLELGILLRSDADGLAALVAGLAVAASAAAAYAVRTQPRAIAPLVMAAAQAGVLTLLLLVRVPLANLRIWDAEPAVEALGQAALLVAGFVMVTIVARRCSVVGDAAAAFGALAAALAALYTVSLAVVALFTESPGVLEQDAQVALTLTWVALGAASLLAGTSERLCGITGVRVFAYSLLALAALKLVVADTAELETPMRVLAFLATGLGLLGSAAFEQRMREGDARR